MRVLSVTQDQDYTSDSVISFGNDSFALSAYRPCLDIANGIYLIVIVINTVKIILGEINFDKKNHKDSSLPTSEGCILNKWEMLENLEWKNHNADFQTFKIIISRKNPTNLNDIFTNPNGKWEFKLFVKDNSEPSSGKREDPNTIITEDFCKSYVDTDRDIGVRCPTEPSTEKQFKKCLNWRRVDEVGKKCRELLPTSDSRDKSIDTFCKTFTKAEDCKCVNRIYNQQYIKDKPSHPEHDYCWYADCSSGYYLLPERDTKVTCEGKYCQVFYSAENIGGSVTITDNPVVQNCTEITRTLDVAPKKKLILKLITCG